MNRSQPTETGYTRSPCLTAGPDGGHCPNIDCDKSAPDSPCARCPLAGRQDVEDRSRELQFVVDESVRRARAAAGLRVGRVNFGHAKFGWKFDEDLNLVEDKEERDLLRNVVRFKRKGLRHKEIAPKLNALGYRTRTGTEISDENISKYLQFARDLKMM